jgi:hypothetical protein
MSIFDKKDVREFLAFQTKTASEYFNEKAAKSPSTAQTDIAIAKNLDTATSILLNMSKKNLTDLSAEEEQTFEAAMTAKGESDEDLKATQALCAKKLPAFISEDPARWGRLVKSAGVKPDIFNT